MELDLDLDYTAILSQKEGEERMVGKKEKRRDLQKLPYVYVWLEDRLELVVGLRINAMHSPARMSSGHLKASLNNP